MYFAVKIYGMRRHFSLYISVLEEDEEILQRIKEEDILLVSKFMNNLNNEPQKHIGVFYTIKLSQFLMIKRYYNEAAL